MEKKMKIVVVLDSFKGSLGSLEAGNAVKEGILKIRPEACVIVKPIADGGEGTTEAIVEACGGNYISLSVHGPLYEKVDAVYGIIPDSKMAIVEMAAAAGITLVKDRLNPMHATTYGVGELIKDAVFKGCRNFIIGIGGSATNDGGIGMLTALGYQFLDKDGQLTGISGGVLQDICRVNTQNVMPELQECNFQIACDVTNPLCGKNGATYIYGPQKGVTNENLENLDRAMRNFADVTAEFIGKDYSNDPGAGAAGGLGFAFLGYLNAKLIPGIDLVVQTIGLQEIMKDADLVFTGEGRLDSQTAMGKAPIGIAKLAKKFGAKVIALTGSVAFGAEKCNESGIDAFFPILREITTLKEAMEESTAKKNIEKTTEQIMRLIIAMRQ